MKRIATFLSLVTFLMFIAPTFAEESTKAEEPAKRETPESTPRSTLQNILSAMSDKNLTQLAKQFDPTPISSVTERERQALIENFSNLLNSHGTLRPVGLVSDDKNGDREDNLPENLDYIGDIRINNSHIDLLLERIQIKDKSYRWLLSHQTIAQLSDLALESQSPIINRVLPENLISIDWKGAPLGHWLVMPIIVLISIFFGRLIYKILSKLTNTLIASKLRFRTISILGASVMPLSIITALVVFIILERYLDISILVRQFFGVFTVTLIWLAVFIFLWSLMDKLSQIGENALREKNRAASVSLIIFLRASAKVVLIILAVLLVLDSNGVDVSTGLAALGIGGIALALGAQKTIENIVGSIFIVIDQPFRVGDFCKIGTMVGTIENIGLRSTRIRTRTDTLVTFPNGILSSEQIENFTLRKKYFLNTMLNLRYETTPSDLENLLAEIWDTLRERDDTEEQGQRVRFIRYGESSLDIEIITYILSPDYDTFLAVQEELLITFGKIIKANNSDFAFPSRTVYLESDHPVALAKPDTES